MPGEGNDWVTESAAVPDRRRELRELDDVRRHLGELLGVLPELHRTVRGRVLRSDGVRAERGESTDHGATHGGVDLSRLFGGDDIELCHA